MSITHTDSYTSGDEFTLDQLARGAGPGFGEGFDTLNHADHDQGGIGAETISGAVVQKRFDRVGERLKAFVRAKEFRVSQRGGKGETEGSTAGLGQVVHGIVIEGGGVDHGLSSSEVLERAAYQTEPEIEWDFSLKTQPDGSRVLVPGAVISVPIGELWNTAQITEQQALEIIEQAPIILLMMAALVAERNARPGVMTFMDCETEAERMVFNHWNGWKPKLTPETVVQLKAACEPFWANEEVIALMAAEQVTV